MSWNDERVELLKKLWTEGLSASQIAAELAASPATPSSARSTASASRPGKEPERGRAAAPQDESATAAPRGGAPRVHAAGPRQRGAEAGAAAEPFQIVETQPEAEVVVPMSRA